MSLHSQNLHRSGRKTKFLVYISRSPGEDRIHTTAHHPFVLCQLFLLLPKSPAGTDILRTNVPQQATRNTTFQVKPLLKPIQTLPKLFPVSRTLSFQSLLSSSKVCSPPPSVSSPASPKHPPLPSPFHRTKS